MASVDVSGTAVSAFANTEGKFQLNGIPAGTYTVTLTPDIASGLPIVTIENIKVANGQVTDVGVHLIE